VTDGELVYRGIMENQNWTRGLDPWTPLWNGLKQEVF